MTDSTQTAGAEHVTDANFQDILNKAGDKPVFVDFYADWCGPCKLAAPIVDRLAGEYQDKAVIVKLDVDENHDTAVKYGVVSIPTVVMFKNGVVTAKKVGFPGEPGYRQMLDGAVAA